MHFTGKNIIAWSKKISRRCDGSETRVGPGAGSDRAVSNAQGQLVTDRGNLLAVQVKGGAIVDFKREFQTRNSEGGIHVKMRAKIECCRSERDRGANRFRNKIGLRSKRTRTRFPVAVGVSNFLPLRRKIRAAAIVFPNIGEV